MPFLLLLLSACPSSVDPCADGGDLEAALREEQVTCPDLCDLSPGQVREEGFSAYGAWNGCSQELVRLSVTVEDCGRCQELQTCIDAEDPGETPVITGMEVEDARDGSPAIFRATVPWTDADGDVDRVLDRVEAAGSEDLWPVMVDWDPPPCGEVSGTVHLSWTWKGEPSEVVVPTSLLVVLADERGHVSEPVTWP